MRLEDLRYIFPETPKSFSSLVEKEVARHVSKKEDCVMEDGNRRKRRSTMAIGKAAAITLIIALSAGTAAYAAERVYHMIVEKEHPYAVTATVKKTDLSELPDEIDAVRIEVGYIPAGLTAFKDGDDIRTYHMADNSAYTGVFFETRVLDQDMNSAKEFFVDAYEEKTINNRECLYVSHTNGIKNGSYSQLIYVPFPEYSRVVIARCTDDLSAEEIWKIAEGLDLNATGEKVAVSSLIKISEEKDYWTVRAQNGGNRMNEIDYAVAEEKVRIVPLDTALPSAGNTAVGEIADTTLTVHSVHVYDDLSSVTWTDRQKQEWEKNLDENGRLKPKELYYIKAGDGKTTKDEIVSRKQMAQKIVVIDTTMTNTTDALIEDTIFFPLITCMDQKDGLYRQLTYDSPFAESYDYIESSVTYGSGFSASVFDENSHGGNHISLEAGESVNIKFAFVVDKDMLPYMYVDPDGDTEVGLHQEGLTKTLSFVDIRQK